MLYPQSLGFGTVHSGLAVLGWPSVDLQLMLCKDCRML